MRWEAELLLRLPLRRQFAARINPFRVCDPDRSAGGCYCSIW
jgi:hypothetical protein